MKNVVRIGSALAVAGLLLAGIGATPAGADTASPPGPIAPGQLGGQGPCTQAKRLEMPNLGPGSSPGQTVWVITPGGSGTPRGGGQCSDNARPVAFVVHGWSGLWPDVYKGLIDNLVSNGYVVVYANHSLIWAPAVTYPNVNAGMVQAAGIMNTLTGSRMDLANIGIWGHSSGAGMVPWLAQQAEQRGWGTSSFWLSLNDMHFAFYVGESGPIHVPANARVQVTHYDSSDAVDGGISIDAFDSFDVPAAQKTFIEVRSDGSYVADHFTPVSNKPTPLPADHLDYYGVWRNVQALGECARTGQSCDADLGYMGTWSDGTPATRADVYHSNPPDVGPSPAQTECDAFDSEWFLGLRPHLCVR